MAEKNYKLGEPIEIIYQAPNAQTGLTIIAEILTPDDVKDSDFPDITLSELVIAGEYKEIFIPDAQGEWKVVIHTDANDGQVVKRYSVGAYNVHSVGEDVSAVNTKAGNIQIAVADVDADVVIVGGLVTNVDEDVALLNTKVDTRADATDIKVDDVDAKAISIETKVDGIVTSVGSLDTPPMVS